MLCCGIVKLNKDSYPEAFCKVGVLKTFANFTEKHLCQLLFFDKMYAEACNFI